MSDPLVLVVAIIGMAFIAIVETVFLKKQGQTKSSSRTK
jgi:hypothetical protein